MSASSRSEKADPAQDIRSAEPGPEHSPRAICRSDWLACLAIITLGAAIFAMRLSAPPNLLDQDQERPASYVLDVIKNGNWLCQRDYVGSITSKPPVWTWLAALSALPFGRLNLFALYLPGALGMTGAALLIYGFGRTHFGRQASFIAALALMLSTAGVKAFGLARTDAVFAFMVTLAALLAWRAWTKGKTWIWFWLAAAAATLTKGPLGVVLAGGGLLAAVWERRSPDRLGMRGSHWVGLALFLVVTGGWFWLSYLQLGPPLVDKMLGKELAAHALSAEKKTYPGMLFYQQPLYYLGRAAPWSILAYYGLWRIWKHPAMSPGERRFERFLFCWFCVGLFIFSMAPHQRADLLWPIMPAGALIAGRELSRFSQRLNQARFRLALGFTALIGLAGFTFYYFGPRAKDPIIQRTIALKRLAMEVETHWGREFPLSHVDSPMTLQAYLNTVRPFVPLERAVELLRSDTPAFVAVKNIARLEAMMDTETKKPLHVIMSSGPEPGSVKIISNQQSPGDLDRFAFYFGPLLVEADGAKLLIANERRFAFAPASQDTRVTFKNTSDALRRIEVNFNTESSTTRGEAILNPGESRDFLPPSH